MEYLRFDETYNRKMQVLREEGVRDMKVRNRITLGGLAVMTLFGISAVVGGLFVDNTDSSYEKQHLIVRAYDLDRDGKLSPEEHEALRKDLALKFAHRAREVESW